MNKYNGPGVYRFRDIYNNIIYVGSSKNIHRRIQSHWSKSGHLPKECYDSVARIEVLKCESYGKALDYEIYFINSYKPKFNHKDKSHNIDSKVVKNDDEYKHLESKWRLYYKLKELDTDKINTTKKQDTLVMVVSYIVFILVIIKMLI